MLRGSVDVAAKGRQLLGDGVHLRLELLGGLSRPAFHQARDGIRVLRGPLVELLALGLDGVGGGPDAVRVAHQEVEWPAQRVTVFDDPADARRENAADRVENHPERFQRHSGRTDSDSDLVLLLDRFVKRQGGFEETRTGAPVLGALEFV